MDTDEVGVEIMTLMDHKNEIQNQKRVKVVYIILLRIIKDENKLKPI